MNKMINKINNIKNPKQKITSLFNKKLELKYKLMMLVMAASLVGISAVSITSYYLLHSVISNQTKNQLQYVKERKATQINNYLQEVKNNSQALTNNRFIQDMIVVFQGAVLAIGTTGTEDTVYSAGYFNVFKIHNERIDKLAKVNKLSGITFVSQNGQVIYTNTDVEGATSKNLLGKNLLKGQLNDSAISTCFQKGKNGLHFVDFSYIKLLDRVISMICVPVHSEFSRVEEGIDSGDTIGVLITEVDRGQIEQITTEHWTPYNERSYIVGADGLPRSSHPNFLRNNNNNFQNIYKNMEKIKNELISFISSNTSLTKDTTKTFYDKENGEGYITSIMQFQPYEKVNWYMVTEAASSIVFKELTNVNIIIFLITFIVLVIMGFVGLWAGKIFSVPIIDVANLLEKRTSELNSLSKMLTDMSNQLSQSAAEQASSTTESVAAMNQMEAMVAQSNDFAHNSQKSTKDVKDKTEEGNKIMAQLSASMDLIRQNNAQLQNISHIINDITKKTNIINEIVFNTKILSFNASIEAARAGQHGRGFAVVAEEVSRLATTSGNAAQEIQDLLDNSKKQVEDIVKNTGSVIIEGHEVALKALNIFKEIALQINDINEHIRGIVQAGVEELDGIKKTSVALHQLDKTAQNNSKVSSDTLIYANQLKELNNKVHTAMNSLEGIILGEANIHHDSKKHSQSQITKHSA
ncbi:MAG: hypothetical protein HQK49_19010 [Oligoflexia bacterium]|nr:hypothetical protein [Oligoflexia bacterium]